MKAKDELHAIEHIKWLKARYVRLIDAGQWSEVMTLFTGRCTFQLERLSMRKAST